MIILLPLCKFVSSNINLEFCIINIILIILSTVCHKPKRARIHSLTPKSIAQRYCTNKSTRISGVLAPTVEW